MKNKIILKEKNTRSRALLWLVIDLTGDDNDDGYNMIILLLLFVAVTS